MRVASRVSLATLWVMVCLGFAYLGDIGRGFIADDYSWIYFSRVRSAHDLVTPLVTTPMGFYRPIVSWSFALNHALFGMAPLPYAWTNLALVLSTLVMIAIVARRLGAWPLAAVFAAGLWALNFHGIGMGLTWVSGRTSLLASCFAIGAAWALTSRRAFLCGALTLGALLSKEEPVLLPAIFAAWIAIDGRAAQHRPGAIVRDVVRQTGPAFIALAIYVGLRLNTLAFTPWDAPEAYALSISPRVLLPNALEYADRSSTLVAGVLALGWLLFARRRPILDRPEWRLVAKGLVWLVLGFGATIMVPTRSDLYACYPSIGAVLIGAAVGAALWRTIPVSRQRLAAIGLVLLPILLLPIYWSRNSYAKDDARMSSRVVADVRAGLEAHPAVSHVVIYEQPNDRVSVFSAFKGTLPKAIELTTGRTPRLDILPIGAPSATRDQEDRETMSFIFINAP